LCASSIKNSFAAGTTDGPGDFDFTQANNSTTNPFWVVLRNIIHDPSEEQVRCHAPKPILLDTGGMDYPYAWQPELVESQVFKIGNLWIGVVPAEFTTMAGRRFRSAIHDAVVTNYLGTAADTKVILTGPGNTYSSYVTTPEEYTVQRYEGAFTLYGMYTLNAYIEEFVYLATAIAKEVPLVDDGDPPDMTSNAINFLRPVVFDGAPFGKHFGSVLVDAQDMYRPGDLVTVTYVAGKTPTFTKSVFSLPESTLLEYLLTSLGNPRNNVTLGSTHLVVEQQHGDSWKIIRTDAYYSTKFKWHRTNTVLGYSTATIEWNIEEGTPG